MNLKDIIYNVKNAQPIPQEHFHLIKDASREDLIEIIRIFNILLEMFQAYLV